MTSNDLEQEVMRVLSLAMDQPSDQQEAWIEQNYGDQPDLKERVLKLLRRDGSAPSLLRTGGARSDAAEPEMPERAGNYQITELIGQGGMGAVYKGRRDSGDFEHVAAIKVVRPGLFSDALTARFERERQTLAGLNHPGIARLFDGGTLPDGSPYIVMELVDGISLTQWIETNPSNENAILGLFEQICDAVSHAHQNLIIHRDLTPSNVLVAGEDTIKLIDFGIAKPQSIDEADDGVSSDSLASLSFTPGFAAPERSQGAPANTLSDVYSLGKLLEAMLKRARPDSDLKSIIERASALQPHDRYASVLAMRDDVRNYKTGYPVDARAGSASYRFGKYLRRRKLLVGFAAASVLALTGALGFTLFQYQRAESALDHASDRFEQARQLSRSMITDVYGAVEQVPGTLEARENMAEIVKSYVEELAADPNAPDNVLMDIAVQNTRLSDVYGGLGIANLGDTETSWALLVEAETALDQLLARNPDDIEAIDEMAWVKRLKANQQLSYQLDVEAARATNDEGLALSQRGLSLPGAEDTRLYFRLWNSRTDRIKILIYENALEEAVETAKRYQEELSASTFEEEPRRRTSRLAYFARQEGEALAELTRWEEAIPPLEAAITSYDEILENDISSYYYKLQKLTTMGMLTLSQIKSGRGPAAIESSDEADMLSRELLSADENDAASWGYVATTVEMVARAQAEFGDKDKAMSAAAESVSIRRTLVQDFPETLSHQRDLAGALKNAGMSYALIAEANSSCEALLESQVIMTRLNETESLTDYDREIRIPEIEDLIAEYDCAAG